MRLHRIVLGKHGATAQQAFGGAGGLHGLGRWHTTGTPIVYTSESIAVSMMEILVHTQRSDKLAGFVRWEIEVPDARIDTCKTLPARWDQDLAVTRNVGDAWLASASSPVLRVPSAVVPQAHNFLLNPMHPQFDFRWVCSGPIAVAFDSRLRPAK